MRTAAFCASRATARLVARSASLCRQPYPEWKCQRTCSTSHAQAHGMQRQWRSGAPPLGARRAARGSEGRACGSAREAAHPAARGRALGILLGILGALLDKVAAADVDAPQLGAAAPAALAAAAAAAALAAAQRARDRAHDGLEGGRRREQRGQGALPQPLEAALAVARWQRACALRAHAPVGAGERGAGALAAPRAAVEGREERPEG